jgi:hypothetical protein
MPNLVLERLREDRAEQISTMDAILEQVGERDLVDAERGILEGARSRIAEIDAQIEPLAAFESLRDAHRETGAALPRPEATMARPVAGSPERDFPYATPGAFVVDYLRAHGGMDRNAPDAEAAARVAAAYAARAVVNQVTGDLPGLLPTPIVGPVVNLIDAQRPLVTSVGGMKPLGTIPGSTFSRPSIAQHVAVGKQTAEKTELPSQKMSIVQIPFAKETWGGTLDISRQSIDWTSPAAWDIIIGDLADVYALQTETAVAADFATNATGTAVGVGTAGAAMTLTEWSVALYTAAMRSYKAGKRMPDRVWCSLDVWASLGSLVDVARLVNPPSGNLDSAAGSSSLADFRGDVIGLPRIVVPMFPDGTCIVGPSSLFEAYEEVIGLLSQVEPSILGVEVAYGGYIAHGYLAPGAFVPLDIAGTLPTVATEDAPTRGNNGNGEDDDAPQAKTANGGAKASAAK